MKTKIALLFTFIFASVVSAANNPGKPGATSEGSLGLSIQVGDVIQITGVKDVSIDAWDGQPMGYDNNTLNQKICVLTNTVSKKYSIEITDNSAAGELSLTGKTTSAALPFTLQVNDGNGNTQEVTTNNSKVDNLIGSTNLGCTDTGGSNLSLDMAIPNPPASLVTDTYSTELRLTVTPATT